MYNTENMYEDTEIMYQVTGETEKVRCDECLKIYQTLRPAPISAVHTESISSQGWPEFSTTESVTSMDYRKVGTEEFKTALDAFLLCFGQSMNIQKLLANGKKKMNSRQRRKKKREDDRNTSDSSPIPPATEPAKAVYQEPAPGKPPERPVTRTSFNRQNTLKMIKEKEEDNLCTEDYFYFDLSRQEAIEILKSRGRNKEFLLRENCKENSPYEICLLKDGHIYILPILFTENEIASEYYISKKIYKVGNKSGLNFGLTYIKTEWETYNLSIIFHKTNS